LQQSGLYNVSISPKRCCYTT